MSKKEVSCVFDLRFTDCTALHVGCTVNIPETAGMPYALTRIAIKTAKSVPDFKTHDNALPIFLWAYYEYVLKPHGLHDLKTLTEKVLFNSNLSQDNAERMANGLMDIIRPPEKFLKLMDALSESDKKGVVTSAAIFLFLEQNKFISTTESNVIDFKNVIDAEEKVPERFREVLMSLFGVVDATIGELTDGQNIVLEV